MFNSVFTSDEIIHNGGDARSPRKTSAASFSVSDWKFVPAHTQPRLTFQPRALILRGGPTKEGCFFCFFNLFRWIEVRIFVSIVLFGAKLNRRFHI